MKKIITTFAIISTLLFSSSSFALDPKLKILGTMSGYGVVGGALLGTASMAFGASAKSIAKGASLGLYGGLLFGTYVILSYEVKKRGFGEQKEDYYPDSKGQYEDNSSGYINQFQDLIDYRLAGNEIKKDPKKDPVLQFNFLNYQF